MLATLLLAGLRISELCDLRWRQVDLAGGRLRIGKAKTDAGTRHVTIRPAVKRASAALVADDYAPLPDRITPQSLRRTFASVLYALGESPAVVMAEMGHTSPNLALAVYTQAMRRDEGATERLQALVEGADWADVGRQGGDASAISTLDRAA